MEEGILEQDLQWPDKPWSQLFPPSHSLPDPCQGHSTLSSQHVLRMPG